MSEGDDVYQPGPWSHIWDWSKPVMLWVMLNPTGQGYRLKNMTHLRCKNIADACGFGAAVAVNIFTVLAPSAECLEEMTAERAIGRGADDIIELQASILGKGGRVVCAWGAHGALHGRGDEVAARLRGLGHTLYVISLTKDGHPHHPIMSSGYKVVEWNP